MNHMSLTEAWTALPISSMFSFKAAPYIGHNIDYILV